jgi:hypothetical protein
MSVSGGARRAQNGYWTVVIVGRVRDPAPPAGEFGHERPCLRSGRVPTELGPLEHGSRLGKGPGIYRDFEMPAHHRLGEPGRVAPGSDEGGHKHGRVDDDPLHYEAAWPESPRSRRMALSSS